jgi:hypothetical protein
VRTRHGESLVCEKDDRLGERGTPHSGAGCRLHDAILFLWRV